MKTSRIGSFLQIGGILGVAAGLVLVAYEIRDTNRIAYNQMAYASASAFQVWESAFTNPEVARVVVKAKENEEPLTRVEMQIYDGFLILWMEAYIAVYVVSQSDRASFDVLEVLARDATHRLDNPVAREWFELNRIVWPAEMAQAIDLALEEAPMGIDLLELDRARLKGGTNN